MVWGTDDDPAKKEEEVETPATDAPAEGAETPAAPAEDAEAGDEVAEDTEETPAGGAGMPEEKKPEDEAAAE